MKKILFIISFVIFCILTASAQNDYYLTTAYKKLSEGNIESAENNYNAYKKMSGQSDTNFESLLKEKKNTENDAWKKECYIVEFNTGKRLAVYKRWSSLLYTYESADELVFSSNLLGFNDWEIPDKDEMALIVATIGSKLPYGNYWTSEEWWLVGDDVIKRVERKLYKKDVLEVEGYYVLQHTSKSSTFYREMLKREYYRSSYKSDETYEPQNRFILVREF